jgi:hypothetical protein
MMAAIVIYAFIKTIKNNRNNAKLKKYFRETKERNLNKTI